MRYSRSVGEPGPCVNEETSDTAEVLIDIVRREKAPDLKGLEFTYFKIPSLLGQPLRRQQGKGGAAYAMALLDLIRSANFEEVANEKQRAQK